MTITTQRPFTDTILDVKLSSQHKSPPPILTGKHKNCALPTIKSNIKQN